MSRDPALAAELAEFKRQQAEQSRLAREAAAPAIQTPEIDASPSPEPRADGAPAKCWYCKGEGVVDGLIGSKKNDCHLCEATGYDLSDPLAVIKLLLAGGRKLRLQYRAKSRELRELRELVGEKEIERLHEAAWVEKIHSRID